MKNNGNKFLTNDILKSSIVEAFKKLNPKYMMKNPVMFVVEVGTVVAFLLTLMPNLFGNDGSGNIRIYNAAVTIILFITILFANFAESVAEGRGKAQADTLKKTRKDTMARLIDKDGNEKMISSSELKKGDVVLVNAGEVIPNDGEVIEGLASVDESAITGESAPVVRESGGDFASVTGGTTVVSDWLKIKITTNPGESFLDKMVLVNAGEVIPNDGEVIEGLASVDESAITGESAPVVRESGGDFASVTGGTTVVSDWLKIKITTNPGESFLDKMISLVEGASRQKTPNEIALNTVLVSFS